MYQTLDEFLVKTSGQNPDQENTVKTLLLLHGWGMNSKVWSPIKEDLQAKYHVLWVDLPGHGVNRGVEARSLSQMVALIASHVPKKTHLLGWSLGGIVAQALAQKIPEKIASLSLIASTPKFSQSNFSATSNQPQDLWQHAMPTEVLENFAENLKQDTVKTLKGFIALQFIGVENAKEKQDALIQQILYADPKVKSAQKWGGVLSDDNNGVINLETQLPTQNALDVGLDILINEDLRQNSAVCPEHWIFAAYDRLIPKQVINDLKYLRPDAQITLLEKAGHAPFITHPEAFLKYLSQFIDSI